MIDVSQLVFEYPGHRALDGISLHIPAGSVTALVGANGAGKSTLLRCMAGLEQPLAGQISVHGISVQEQPREVHRQLGYLSDFYGLHERLSVAHCLQYAALATGLPPAEAQTRAQDVAAQLGLHDLLQRRPSELSRGQRQRVAIGQAIVHRPRVLLLDEPASGLDPEARSSLSQLFLGLQAQGMTLVVSSHILSELDEYCSHILGIRSGRIDSHEALHGKRWTAAPGATAEPALSNLTAPVLYALELAPAPDAAAQAQQMQRLYQALQGMSVHGERLHGDTALVQLWLPPTATARAQWLAQLVQAGLPVAGLWPVRESLQDRYVRGARETQNGEARSDSHPSPQEQP